MGSPAPHGPRVKGSVVRGLVEALERAGLLERVTARTSPETRDLLTRPPLPTAWVSSLVLAELYDTILELEGGARLREVVRDATAGAGRVVMPVIAGLMRLFGVVPSTLLQRMNQLISTFATGVTYDFRDIRPGLGEMTVQFAEMQEPSKGSLLAMGASFETMIELAGHRGHATLVGLEKHSLGAKARFQLLWEKP